MCATLLSALPTSVLGLAQKQNIGEKVSHLPHRSSLPPSPTGQLDSLRGGWGAIQMVKWKAVEGEGKDDARG